MTGALFTGRWTLLMIVTAGFLALLVAGCTREVVKEVPVEVVVEKEVDPGKLVVYSGRSEALVDNIIQQFAQATGIDVEVRYANTGQLAATLLEEGDNSPADLSSPRTPAAWGPWTPCWRHCRRTCCNRCRSGRGRPRASG